MNNINQPTLPAPVHRLVGRVCPQCGTVTGFPPASRSDKQAGWQVEFEFCDRIRYEIRKTVGIGVTTKDCEDILLIIDKWVKVWDDERKAKSRNAKSDQSEREMGDV